MAKYRALMNFRAIKEKVSYKEGQEFEMPVTRAKELQANVDKNFPNAGQVMERIDNVKEEAEKLADEALEQAEKALENAEEALKDEETKEGK